MANSFSFEQVRAHQIAPAILSALGLAPAPNPEQLSLPAAPRVCLALIDGMGYEVLQERRAHLRFLRPRLELSPIRTCVPSTTAAAITTVMTGQLPGQTNMLGYEVVNPESGVRFNLINFSGADVEPQKWQPHPSIFETLNELGVKQMSCGKPKFIGSGLTLAAQRGSNFIACRNLDENVEAVIAQMHAGAQFAYFYYEGIDHAAHGHGWQSDDCLHEIEAVDAALEKLARRLPEGTLLVIVADHGLVDIGERLDVGTHPRLSRGVTTFAGEARALHVHFKPDFAEEGISLWRKELSERADIFTREEMATLTGPLANPRILGDITVFPHGTLALVDTKGHSLHACMMPGMHGGLTDAEMLIPFIVEAI